MIEIKHLDFIPDLSYTDYSRKELLTVGAVVREIEKASTDIWVVLNDNIPLLVGGIIPQSLVCTPRLWFLLCKEFTTGNVNWNLRALKQLMKVLDEKHGRVETLVEDGWEQGRKFATFCGFRLTNRTYELDNKTYVVMER